MSQNLFQCIGSVVHINNAGVVDELDKDENETVLDQLRQMCVDTIYNNGSSGNVTVDGASLGMLFENVDIRDDVLIELLKPGHVDKFFGWWEANQHLLTNMNPRYKVGALTALSTALILNEDFDKAIDCTELAAKYVESYSNSTKGARVNNSGFLYMLGSSLRGAMAANEAEQLSELLRNSLKAAIGMCAPTLEDVQAMMEEDLLQVIGPRQIAANFDDILEHFNHGPALSWGAEGVFIMGVNKAGRISETQIYSRTDSSDYLIDIARDMSYRDLAVIVGSVNYLDRDQFQAISESCNTERFMLDVMWVANNNFGSYLCEDEHCCGGDNGRPIN